MRLAIHSNASYLSEPKARSRAGGHMFMAGTEDIPINNGAVLNILQIIRAVMSLAAEAKLGTLFIDAKRQSQCNAHSKKLDICKCAPQSKPTIDCPCTTYQKNSAQGIEGHGHAIPLFVLPRITGPVSILLETWNTKFGGLLDQASSSQPPQGLLTTNPNINHH
jgi:hypothetical protein